MKRYSLEESIKLQKAYENSSIKKNFSDIFSSVKRKKKNNLEKFTDNELLNALIAVTKILKISIDGSLIDDVANAENLEAMADHVSIPVRHVQIDDDFASYDSGVFFTKLDDKNVVIFRRMRSYYVYECSTGLVYKYSSSMKLSSSVLQFYKPFNNQILTLKEFLKYTYDILGKEIVYFLALGLLLSILSLAAPIAMKYLIEDILPEANTQLLLEYSLGLFAFGLGTALFMASKGLILLYIEGKLAYYIETATWYRILNFPVGFFKKYKSADISIRADAANSIRNILAETTVSSIFGGLFSTISFLALCYISWQIAIIIACILLLFQLVSISIVFRQIKVMKEYLDDFSNIVSDSQERVDNIQKIKSSCSEHRVFSNFIKSNRKQVELRYKFKRYENIENTLNIILKTFIFIIVYVLVTVLFSSSKAFSLSSFIMFNSLLGSFMGSFISMMQAFVKFAEIKPHIERFKPIAMQEVESDSIHKITPKDLYGDIEFKNVSFKYEDGERNVIDNASFVIKKGEFVAITGPSGSGKSTLLKLLLGFNLPNKGDITYNNYSIHDINLRTLRQQIGVVLQKTELFDSDIYTNIRTNMQVGLGEVNKAVKMSGLEQDIKNLPMGLFTILQANGSSLSGGQRQRIAIARAMIRNPFYLYFDEATSALDNVTQSIVIESLQNFDNTKVVIAHRKSTIKNADKIIELKDGKIVRVINCKS
ncbi:ATP-binding cassette domain-containing protein [Francisella hispaniensis]|uniref:ATP-binding cassette domain-containing protein n=1 Tax=Francisella hispaniensis TaxID=622488 RepID=UPI001904532E|nr:ATP-binding cassette domain-containing protein [Francisella hispaniensis]MBK2357785.1 ATP-binding cassette domain-containing protein [Francisella hispaniensis]